MPAKEVSFSISPDSLQKNTKERITMPRRNICPKLEIPIYMIMPRLFTCPTLITKNFKIEFELNLVIVFKDDYIISENFPIILKRLHGQPGVKVSNRGA
ncbi:hypothetical protein DOY81_012106 [Sarcophaga bullata]|nr:hypothetical protein DOY81_012106 [Sarcophaga bullata]